MYGIVSTDCVQASSVNYVQEQNRQVSVTFSKRAE